MQFLFHKLKKSARNPAPPPIYHQFTPWQGLLSWWSSGEKWVGLETEKKYLGGNFLEVRLVWLDGTKTDFTFWAENSQGRTVGSGCCNAIFSSLIWTETSCWIEKEKGVENFVLCRSSLNHKSNENISGNEISTVFKEFFRKFFIIKSVFYTIIHIKLAVIVFALLKVSYRIWCGKK